MAYNSDSIKVLKGLEATKNRPTGFIAEDELDYISSILKLANKQFLNMIINEIRNNQFDLAKLDNSSTNERTIIKTTIRNYLNKLQGYIYSYGDLEEITEKEFDKCQEYIQEFSKPFI